MANISFTYKKYLDAPYVDVVVYNSAPVDIINYRNCPVWIKMITQAQTRNGSGKITSYTYRVSVDPVYANNLTPGIHKAEIQITALSGNNFEPYQVNIIYVTLEVIDTVALSLSKTVFNFAYAQGSPAPATQPLTITTENPWSIVGTSPWLTFSAQNGNSTQIIDLGVDVNGLAIGLYEATFQVDDGASVKQGTVSLLISGSDESGDVLVISRSSISFSEVFQQAPTRSANITIESTLQATITTPTPWLNISAGVFAPGTNQLIINTQNTEGLALGNFSGTVKIETGFSTKIINVLLRIVQEVSEGIVSDALYYADDRNTLILSTAVENAEAYMEFQTNASGSSREYKRRVPYFNNLAPIVIGLETKSFLKPENLPAEFYSGVFTPVKPLEMGFVVYDKVIHSSAITERLNFSGIKFLNGTTPALENKLSNIPAKITLPLNGLVTFSFYSEAPVNGIDISGDYVGIIPVNAIATKVYAAVVDLATLGLVEGNKVTISCGPVSVEVIVRNPELSTYRLIYLNKWDCPEILSLDGPIQIDEEENSKTVTVAEAGKIISRITEVRESSSFRVGTGNLYSDAEVNWLSGILRSKKMWLEIAGQRVEVIRTFKSLPVYKTREFNLNYTLTFDAAVQ